MVDLNGNKFHWWTKEREMKKSIPRFDLSGIMKLKPCQWVGRQELAAPRWHSPPSGRDLVDLVLQKLRQINIPLALEREGERNLFLLPLAPDAH